MLLNAQGCDAIVLSVEILTLDDVLIKRYNNDEEDDVDDDDDDGDSHSHRSGG